jgi:beta-glucosidase
MDQYNNDLPKMQEDVRIMKDMGVDAYRFSISWTRILPSKCDMINCLDVVLHVF